VEAEKICALAKPTDFGLPLTQVIDDDLERAKKLAKEKPESPEGLMMSALEGTDQDFETQLKAAYVQVACSGADVRLSPGEIVAIYNYTTNNYMGMNEYAQNGPKQFDEKLIPEGQDVLERRRRTEAHNEAMRKKVDATKAALEKLPKYNGGE